MAAMLEWSEQKLKTTMIRGYEWMPLSQNPTQAE